jgi:hypothetical protein
MTQEMVLYKAVLHFRRFHAANVALLYGNNKAKTRAILDRAL